MPVDGSDDVGAQGVRIGQHDLRRAVQNAVVRVDGPIIDRRRIITHRLPHDTQRALFRRFRLQVRIPARIIIQPWNGAVIRIARVRRATDWIDDAVRQFLQQRLRIQLRKAGCQKTLVGRTAEHQRLGRLPAERQLRIGRAAKHAVLVAADGGRHFQALKDGHQQLGIQGLDVARHFGQRRIAWRQQDLGGVDILRELVTFTAQIKTTGQRHGTSRQLIHLA